MKKLLKDGYMMSRSDRLAVANDLLEPLEDWAMKGPKFHMSGKPVKAMKAKWMNKLREEKAKVAEPIPANDADIVSEIKGMDSFKSEYYKSSELIKPSRSQPRDEKILANGIDVEDHEHEAAISHWNNPDEYLVDLLDNKIARCKERMVKYWTEKFNNDPSVESYPSDVDDFIEFVVARPEYKNRAQLEAEVED